MLRRSVLQLSSRRSAAKLPVQLSSQIPSHLSSRKAFSAKSKKHEYEGPDPAEKQSGSGRQLEKVIGGALLLGSFSYAAYHYGFMGNDAFREKQHTSEPVIAGIGNKNLNEFQRTSQSSEISEQLGETISRSTIQDSKAAASTMEQCEDNARIHSDLSQQEHLNKNKEENQFQVQDTSELARESERNVKENDLLSTSEVSLTSPEINPDLKSPEIRPNMVQHEAVGNTPTLGQDPVAKENDMKSPDTKPDMVQHEAVGSKPTPRQDNLDPTEDEKLLTYMQHITTQDMPKDDTEGHSSSLLDEYYLTDKDQETIVASNRSKVLDEAIKDLNDGYISKDGKLVLDFLEAIHEAEKRQAELDARSFAEENKIMKEKYEKELKDARARELMYAERESILDKELNRERAKAAAALKSLQEKLEEKHKMELEEKEVAAELELNKLQELAKAELDAAIASEKASQIEKMAEANLHINALCMAFYARSEEARHSHSAHKIALGALALEDALSKGLPIHKEVEALHAHLESIDKDSLLDLVLSSLPEETQTQGTDTLSQLNHKFDALKQTLRHFSLIRAGGGGIFTHSLAHIASRLKVKEVDESGDGIESLINRVESLLAQGKLCEAADTLENGVKGSQAAEIVNDWVKRARNRALTEQALTLLQSYAISISLT